MKANKKEKASVLWFQAITCNGNTHSFLSANHNRMKLFSQSFNLIYHPSLSVDVSFEKLLKSRKSIDFLLVEGAISSNKKFFSICFSSTTTKNNQ